jgi:biotin carboxyl carrier protein
MTAHRRLANLCDRTASDPQPSASAASAHRTVPRLNARGPLALGLMAILLFMAAGLGAAFTRLGDLAALAGGELFQTRLTAVALPKGGTAARVHVRAGDVVQAGDLLVTLDTATVDRQIAALKAQARTATRQLALVRQEALGLVRPADAPSAGRPVLASLEQRTGELEQEAQWLLARIAAAEEELARSEVRAPASGGWWRSGVLGPNAPIAPGGDAGSRSPLPTGRCWIGLVPVWRGLAPSRPGGVQLAEPHGWEFPHLNRCRRRRPDADPAEAGASTECAASHSCTPGRACAIRTS